MNWSGGRRWEEILSSYSLLIISSSLAGKVGNSLERFQSAWKPALPALWKAFVSSVNKWVSSLSLNSTEGSGPFLCCLLVYLQLNLGANSFLPRCITVICPTRIAGGWRTGASSQNSKEWGAMMSFPSGHLVLREERKLTHSALLYPSLSMGCFLCLCSRWNSAKAQPKENSA